MTDSPGEGDYLEQLARFVALTRVEDIPRKVLDRAADIFVDTFAVIAQGMRTDELRKLADTQLSSASPGPCWVIGSGRTTNSIDAAMLNGIAGAWHDFDEGNTLANGHPGIQVLPVALALGQVLRRPGREVLAAFALGYEVVARIGRATRVKLIVNPHGTFGVVGSALVSGRLSGYPPDRMRALASLAACTCMATNRHTMIDSATIRNWYAGHSGFMGQMALRLAQSGLTGTTDGVNTTFSLVLGDGFDRDKAVEGLGESWMLPEGYIKLHPTARYVHSAIDAWNDALSRMPAAPAPEDIDHIDIKAYKLAAFLDRQIPADWFGTRFSLPFAIATLAVGGRTGLDAFSAQALADPRVRALCLRISVNEDPGFTAEYPSAQNVLLTVRMRDGSYHEGRCTVTSGEPSRPIPRKDLDQKYFDLAEPVWGADRARTIRNRLRHLEDCEDVSQLFDFNP